MPIVMISKSLQQRTPPADERRLRDQVLRGFGVSLNARKRTLLKAAPARISP